MDFSQNLTKNIVSVCTRQNVLGEMCGRSFFVENSEKVIFFKVEQFFLGKSKLSS